ncbi:MAG: NUDIX domain-containing protein [Candidatus Micrarchaeaceae archaeon]
MAESLRRKCRTVEKDGTMAVIVNDGKVLLLKRRFFPFMVHPGFWSFVSGSRKKGESHLGTAYREIKEETGIGRTQLRPIVKNVGIMIVGQNRDIRWANKFFIFESKDRNVRLNIENSAYKWARVADLDNEEKIITDFIENSGMVLKLIKSSLKPHN